MKLFVRLTSLALAVIMLLALASCGAKNVRFATGGATGTYYAYGTAITQVIADKAGVKFTVSSTGASKENIQLITNGEADLATVQNDVMSYAYKGTDLFADTGKLDAFYALGALYNESCQIIVNENSGIQTVADLKGKKVSVGAAGSGVEFNAKQILEVYDITFSDIDKQNLDFASSADALKDAKIDAFFCTAGAPTSAITNLATTNSLKLLEIDDEHADKLIASYPFYTKQSVPAGTYSFLTNDVQIVTVKATLIVSKNLDDDTVYNITKALFDCKEDITAAHKNGQFLDPAYAVSGIDIPFHPGAEKYFKEVGALK